MSLLAHHVSWITQTLVAVVAITPTRSRRRAVAGRCAAVVGAVCCHSIKNNVRPITGLSGWVTGRRRIAGVLL